jgi:hypothetical protein
MDKYTWTVAGSTPGDRPWTPDRFGEELPDALRKLLPSATAAHITIQDPAQLSASVDGSRAGEPVHAVLEVQTSEHWPTLDDFQAYLRGLWPHVQGWQVRPTLIYDSTRPRPLGEPSRLPSILTFIERLDGTTPAHFSSNWYRHAGHPDGQEAESDASRAERRREEAEGADRIYVQNRVIEPITPTSWLVHGYTCLQLGFSVPELPAEPYARVRGEADFDRWPPRIVQGFEYQVL